MWVKICANTCVEDALKAAELGADALGFVFAPSKRQVTAAQVKPIVAALPRGIECVGVFGSGTVQEIAEAVEEANLTTVQLHSGLDLEFNRSLQERLGSTVSIIQTLHWTVGDDKTSAARVHEQLRLLAETGNRYRVLLDAKVSASPLGGTGKSFDWESARAVLRNYPETRVIVAGGLRCDNVAEAVRVLQPWGVDVASGVEREPGRKDFDKLESFIKEARRAG